VRVRIATTLLTVLLLAACGQAPPTTVVSPAVLPPRSAGEVSPKATEGDGASARSPVDLVVAPPTPPAPPDPPQTPLPGGEPLPPEAWAAALAGRSPEIVTAMARLYRRNGMTTLVVGTPYGDEPVAALAEWLGALTEMGFTPAEIGLDRIAAASGGACGWRMGSDAAPGPGDPLARVAPAGTPWEPPVVRFQCDSVARSTADLDLAFVAVALTAAQRLNRTHGPPEALVQGWAGPEHLLADLDNLLPRSERFWFKLRAFRRIAGPWSHGDFPVPGAWGTLKRGQHGPRVARLRRRLAAEGFLAPAEAAGRTFDRTMRDAVLAYRDAYGLKHRGRVDREILKQLSQKPEALLANLAASMRAGLEKGWDRHATYVLVNIPAFRTHLYVDGRRLASYRSVVGFPYQEPGGRTPEYDAKLSYVDINPTWTPSAYMVSHELERKARGNPSYWRKEHFVRRGARWIQDPGPWNTLGQLVLAWPNEENISLHGTNEPHPFEYLDRALSHGCVRVEGIDDLAARILALAARSPEGGLDPLVRDVVERRIELDGAIPIQVIYDRISITDTGATGHRPDVYNLDPRSGNPRQRLAPLLSALSEARKARRLAAN